MVNKKTTIALFKEIIQEMQESLPMRSQKKLERDFHIPIIQNKGTTIIGVRRSGKSTLLALHLNQLKQKGETIIEINFFDERLSEVRSLDLQYIQDAVIELGLGDSKRMIHYCFDEIQEIEGWELFVERMIRTPNQHIYLTGSSAKLLSKEVATQLRGRTISEEVFPFSFKEIIQWEKTIAGRSMGSRSQIRARFLKYLKEGGFPEALAQEKFIKSKLLQEYLELLIFRDILERHQINSIGLVKNLLKQLLSQFSSRFTINKTTERLKSLGFSCTKEKVSNILQFAEDCYLIFSVHIHSESVAKQNTNPKKIYAIDSGLVHATLGFDEKNSGRLLENTVFLELRRKEKQIQYYLTKSGLEVDFIINGKHLYQVCESLSNEETRKREVKALTEAMTELKIKTGTIITLDETETIKTAAGKIEVIGFEEFFL